MTDITELAPAMKAAAKKATPGPWALARNGKTVVSNQSHPIANVTDVMHRMLADGTTGQDAEFISLANPANILALVEALEKAQAQSSKWLEAYHKAVSIGARYEERIAELESRTVTVKLPFTPEPSAFAPWVAKAFYQFHKDTVKSCVAVFSDACATAGIKWEVE
ncbi:ead/Ea22-like family protein [Klebsiella pneumoniae]|uniref:ead/Ea22-like family protein n=1 Tax=Klebsiella pneumoniae TaxID=573 RepID=UPI001EFB386E|nr:ead/Ea22-like family protein [Klebsiella pneumoniae]MCG8628049.1 ead/Ea22-like family protein [Klebsiella pneumoniae]MCG8674049.1 ead/Ea22-like family protein [Klebsiella pneumoniae]